MFYCEMYPVGIVLHYHIGIEWKNEKDVQFHVENWNITGDISI